MLLALMFFLNKNQSEALSLCELTALLPDLTTDPSEDLSLFYLKFLVINLLSISLPTLLNTALFIAPKKDTKAIPKIILLPHVMSHHL